MLPRLFEEQLEVVAGGEPDQLETIGQVLDDFGRAGAD
jgi:hypothetical protein